MKKFLFIFFVFLSFCGGASFVQALTVSPVVIDFDLLPGSVQDKEITIINEGVARAYILPTLFQVTGTDENGFPQIQAVSQDALLASIVSFPDGVEVSLAPGEKRKLTLRVSVPNDIPAGGYYGVVSWGGSSILNVAPLSGQPGVNLAINIQGDVSEGARIDYFSRAVAEEKQRGPAVFFEASIQNVGGRHFMPTASIEIRNIFNRKVATLPLQSRTRILPGTSRTLSAQWGEVWAFGPYRAILKLDAQGAGVHTAETSFSVYSRTGIIAVFFISLATLVILTTIRSRRKKR